ncbi:PepSY-associated TM helix domain-containing protein [Plantibacter sp. VKM Ac-2876]|uniref:PepSY-associated TM helix domain-containing protein n=1 Tax=Plantibacter sp. VKM Ac-2876 TaxID=2783826 RepID=UPI00188BC5E7|nr:PepSY domain-containing protein [Plantibacter sp. VKM Ac-2876]
MTTHAPAHLHADGPPQKPDRSRGWFPQLLLRLHFITAIFVGPFILVAATSGALYALTPQLEQLVYAEQLHAPVADEYLPLADQIEAANAYTKDQDTVVAVRPAPNPGDTTRVMYTGDGLGESETRAVFVDPATAQIRGDLTAYGTSGALPLRTWIDQLHRNLHLGEVGRLYSELAASWLGVVALVGLGLWIARIRTAHTKRDFVRPNNRTKGYRRILSWHTSTGIWLLVGALFLSATGITWSQYGGGNVGTIRAAFDWSTPSVTTDLSGESTPADEHAGHGGAAAPTSDPETVTANPATFDAVLSVAREVNINTGLVEITPPATAGTAWVVQEIQRSFPTEVDAVAIDGRTMQVTDRVDFADFPLAAKLTRWGVDTHMGSMFGLPNQLLLFALASGIVAMVVWGYVMWWQRRPTREPGRIVGRAPARGALGRAPWWGVAAVLVVAAGIGTLLPLLGLSLAAFVVVDVLLGLRARLRSAETG